MKVLIVPILGTNSKKDIPPTMMDIPMNMALVDDKKIFGMHTIDSLGRNLRKMSSSFIKLKND